MKVKLRLLPLFLLALGSIHSLSCSGHDAGQNIFEREAFTDKEQRIKEIVAQSSTAAEIIAALQRYASTPCRVEFLSEWKEADSPPGKVFKLEGTTIVVDEKTFALQHMQLDGNYSNTGLLMEDILFNAEVRSFFYPSLGERTVKIRNWEGNGFIPQGGLLLAPAPGIHPLNQVVNLAKKGHLEVKRDGVEIILSVKSFESNRDDAPDVVVYRIGFSSETGHPTWSEWESKDGKLSHVEIKSFSFPSDLTSGSIQRALEEDDS